MNILRITRSLLLAVLLVGIVHGETITVPFATCGGVATASPYSGLVEVTVGGYGVITPGNPSTDAFFGLSVADPSVTVGPNPEGFRVSRASEGGCTCYVECAGGNHAVSSLLTGAYPVFDPAHNYSVTMDLGVGVPERLTFGVSDCGCGDNSGAWTVTIDQVPGSTTTVPPSTTTTTTQPPDEDGDGVADSSEAICCFHTPSGEAVNAVGCALEQVCPCASPCGRIRWQSHGEYVHCVKAAALEFLSKPAVRQATTAARASACGR